MMAYLSSTAPVTFLLIFQSFLNFSPSNAFPGGAAVCIQGSNAPGGPHTNMLKGNTDADFTTSIEGIGELNSITYLQAGEDFTLTIASNDGNNKPFKGFLIRVSEANGVDLSGSLSVPNESKDIQIMESTGEKKGSFPNAGACAEGVAGATHTLMNGLTYDKTAVSAVFSLKPELVPDILTVTMEVTILTKTAEYYYSSWPLMFKKENMDVGNLTDTTEEENNEKVEESAGSTTDKAEEENNDEAEESAGTHAVSSTTAVMVLLGIGSWLLV